MIRTFFILNKSGKDPKKRIIYVTYNCTPSSKFKYSTGVEVEYSPAKKKDGSFDKLRAGTGNWDNKKKQIKAQAANSQEDNKTINKCKAYVEGVIKQMTNEAIELTPESIRQYIAHSKAKQAGNTNDQYVLRYLAANLESIPHTNKPNTLKIYLTLKNYLTDFEKHTARTGAMQYKFSEMGNSFYQRFVGFLRKKIADSAIEVILITFKRVLKHAEVNGLVKDSQYKDLTRKKLGLQKNDFVFVTLSEQEILQLYSLRNQPEKFEHFNPKIIRREIDRFVLATQVGLRHSDWHKLNQDNLIQENGRYYIETTEQKRGKKITIPLTKLSIEIMQRYDYNFPPLATPTVNQYLKVISRLAGLNTKESGVPKWKLVTTHTARHSFITIALLRGVPVADIAGITGQSFAMIEKYENRNTRKKADNYLDKIEGERVPKEREIKQERLRKVS